MTCSHFRLVNKTKICLINQYDCSDIIVFVLLLFLYNISCTNSNIGVVLGGSF